MIYDINLPFEHNPLFLIKQNKGDGPLLLIFGASEMTSLHCSRTCTLNRSPNLIP